MREAAIGSDQGAAFHREAGVGEKARVGASLEGRRMNLVTEVGVQGRLVEGQLGVGEQPAVLGFSERAQRHNLGLGGSEP